MPKQTVDDFDKLDIQAWSRTGRLDPSKFFDGVSEVPGRRDRSVLVDVQEDHVVLGYGILQADRRYKQVKVRVDFVFTPCNYGGKRPWFLCPGCSRRAAALYGGDDFKCRKCWGLAYSSQQVGKLERSVRRAQARRIKFGGTGSLVDSFPPKPPHMRYKTYDKMVKEDDAVFWALAAGIPPPPTARKSRGRPRKS